MKMPNPQLNPSNFLFKVALLIPCFFIGHFRGFCQIKPLVQPVSQQLPQLPVLPPQSLPHGYAHNDYFHKRPLLDALDNGFTHVEADVYLRHSRLVVSHNPPLFRRKHTIEELYLQPLLKRFETARTEGPSALDTIVLMIDIKSRGRRTICALNKVLTQY